MRADSDNPEAELVTPVRLARREVEPVEQRPDRCFTGLRPIDVAPERSKPPPMSNWYGSPSRTVPIAVKERRPSFPPNTAVGE